MAIDWTRSDGTPELTCECRCVLASLRDGDEVPTFRSHARFVSGVGLRSRRPCPRCGRDDDLSRVGTDREPG